MIEGIESKDWVKLCASLNKARRFTIFHSELLLLNLEKAMMVLVEVMKNPRSALSRLTSWLPLISSLLMAISYCLIQQHINSIAWYGLLQPWDYCIFHPFMDNGSFHTYEYASLGKWFVPFIVLKHDLGNAAY
ncbi:hypothetical protein LINGRAHAP2_LOCUS10389 [Linum grandiflorum]